jgi:hypothetical protein
MKKKKFPVPPFPFILFLSALFLLRLAFGLCSEIWFIDQQQIYLIGLKFYSTGGWPYFGPDVAAHIQLPGALQGLVVGLPLFLCSIPEAPYILLNLLSFVGLCLFAWYCTQHLPKFPKWIIYTWLLTAPWVLNWSTNIDNDSYVIFGSCLFFIGFLETLPALSLKKVQPSLANCLMGFALLWNAQFHMSYVILFPFLLVSFYFQLKAQGLRIIRPILFFALGALIPGSFILPTLMTYGLAQGTGGASNAVTFNPQNFLSFFDVLGRYFALGACEIPRFMGANMADRLEFLRTNWWIAPFAVTAGLLGGVQWIVLIVSAFRKKHPQKDWMNIKLLTFLTFTLLYISFLFSIKTPAAHTYYLTLPVVMLYGFYVFTPWVGKKGFQTTAKILLACNILFHMGLAIHNLPVKSIYKDRGLFVKAIEEKNYHLLGERRPDTLY